MSLPRMMLTRKEREALIAGHTPHYTGFTPRPIEQLSIRRKPTSSIDIECRHRLRVEKNECVDKNPSVQFRLWLEAGKHRPPYPEKPDASYNSNAWRNFRRRFNFSTQAAGQTIPEVIAAMYPLKMLKPSKVGDHTFTKYLQESKLFENEKKYKTHAVERTKTDLSELKRLKMKTEARNPPVDKNGSILPPKNFKKHIFIPPELYEDATYQTLSEDNTDMFGQWVVPILKPPICKLSSLNKAQFKQVKDEINLPPIDIELLPHHEDVFQLIAHQLDNDELFELPTHMLSSEELFQLPPHLLTSEELLQLQPSETESELNFLL